MYTWLFDEGHSFHIHQVTMATTSLYHHPFLDISAGVHMYTTVHTCTCLYITRLFDGYCGGHSLHIATLYV